MSVTRSRSTERERRQNFGYAVWGVLKKQRVRMRTTHTNAHGTHAWAKDASISAFDFSAMPTATLPRKVSKPWRLVRVRVRLRVGVRGKGWGWGQDSGSGSGSGSGWGEG